VASLRNVILATPTHDADHDANPNAYKTKQIVSPKVTSD
jgi:hypothetical protein